MTRLADRVAAVTGGARGIGVATAYKLGTEGARVTIADVDAEAGAHRLGWLREAGVDAVATLTGDVECAVALKALFDN